MQEVDRIEQHSESHGPNQCDGAYTTRVPFSRMNEALQRVVRKGGRVVSVVVSGEG